MRSTFILVILALALMAVSPIRVKNMMRQYGDQAEAGTPSTVTTLNNANENSGASGGVESATVSDTRFGHRNDQTDYGREDHNNAQDNDGVAGTTSLYGYNEQTQLVTTDGSDASNVADDELTPDYLTVGTSPTNSGP